MKKNKPNRLFNMVNIVLVLTVVLSVPNFSSDYAGKVSAEDLEIIEAIGIPVIEDNAIDFEENTEKEISEIDTTETESVPTEITNQVLELDIDEQANDSIENKQNTSENYSKNIMDELETNNANKEDETTNFTFRFTGKDGDSTATVTGYLGTSKSVSIPSTVTNFEAGWAKESSVTAIGKEAFYGKSLTEVIIPSSVTSIGDDAFRDNALTSVTIPDSVTSIGGYAFYDNALTSVSLGNSVTSIGVYAFRNNALTSITIPNSVTSIGTFAFQFNELTSVSLGNSVTSIGTFAFEKNPLEKIKVSSEQIDRFKDLLIPRVMDGVTVRTILEAEESTENYSYARGTLEEYKVNTANRTLDFEVTGPTRYQLGDLTALRWLDISPELSVEWYKNNETTGNKTTKLTVSNVGKSQEGTYYAVVNGTRLPDINVVVDDYVFEFTGTDGDSTATITEYVGTDTDISIPSIAMNTAAGWMTGTPVVDIKAGLSGGYKGVFSSKGLTNVKISQNMITIGRNAFYGNNLTSIDIPNSVINIGVSAFENNKLTSVSFPDSVTTIAYGAFNHNELTSVNIGDNITTIGSFAFGNNPLETIKVSSKEIDRIKDLLTPSVMNGVTVRTILEPEEGFSYTETTQAVNNLVEGESTQFGIDGKGYQLQSTSSRNWIELKYQWMKEELKLNNNTRQFDLNNVTESDGGLYHAVVGEGNFSETLSDIEVNIIPRQDREIPNTNPENPSINPTDPNPEISALGIRYVSSFTFGEIPFSQNQREVTSTELEDTEGNPMPHMITIQDAREKANRNGWELRVKQESKMMDGSELILNPYVHEKNSEQYGVNVPSTDLILNEESQRVASVEGDGNSYEPGIFSIGLSGSENEGVRLSIPGGVGVGKYNTTLTWNLIEGP